MIKMTERHCISTYKRKSNIQRLTLTFNYSKQSISNHSILTEYSPKIFLVFNLKQLLCYLDTPIQETQY